MRSGRRAAPWSLTLALLGAALVCWITPYGSGLSPDSVYYVAAARWALAGDGVRSLDGGAVIRSPPLYPVALAAGAWVSRSDPVDVARWLNATLFAALVGLAVLLAARIARRPAAGIAAALVLLVSKNTLELHAMAWSEPLAIVVGTSALVLVARHIETGRIRFLALAAIGLGLAALDRYAAVAYAITGAAGLLLLDRATAPLRRTAKAVILALLAVGPLLLWWHGAGARIGLADRVLDFHPLRWWEVDRAAATIIGWIAPPELFSRLSGALLLMLTAAVGAWAFRRADPQTRTGGPLGLLLLLFAPVYIALVVLLKLALSTPTGGYGTIPLDSRILGPVQIVLVIASAGLVGQWLPNPISQRARLMLLAIVLALVAAHGTVTARWARAARAEGLFYAKRSLRTSGLLNRVRALPPTVRLWSNAPDLIYIRTGRCARRLPRKTWAEGARLNPSFASDWRALLGQSEAYVVWFSAFTWRSYLPTESELATAPSVVPLASFADGTLYRIAASPAESLTVLPQPPCPPAPAGNL